MTVAETHPEPTRLLLDLFATVPHVMVSVKADSGRYVGVNEAFVRRARRRHPADVLGRRAADLFPAALAASYDAQDHALRTTGQAVRNHLELIADADADGERRWYLTSKILSESATHGNVVVATSVDAQLGDRSSTGLRAAIELAHDRFRDGLTAAEMAGAADMSTDRLERAMQRVLGISPKQYVLRIRAEHAATLLATTDETIAQIAADSGYFDQSQLTRQFRAHVGLTPNRYRSQARAPRRNDA
ncbi:MAG: helix-turn-helix domain-containing protein [Ilumatobacteraceae bacterium]